MYVLVYYQKETTGQSVVEKEFNRGEAFRLRKNALNYLMEVKQDYKNLGFETRTRVGGIHCFKGETTAQGDRKITDIIIKVEKA